MAQKNKDMLGLALIMGASYVLLTGLSSGSSDKPVISGGGSAGGFVLPFGYGLSEPTNPNSTGVSYPDVNIYESNDFNKNLPTSNAPAPTKKSSSAVTSEKLNDGTVLFRDSSGKLTAVQDSPLVPNPQSRIPTAKDNLIYGISGGSSSSSKKSSSASTPTSSGSTSFASKVGSVFKSIVKGGIFR